MLTLHEKKKKLIPLRIHILCTLLCDGRKLWVKTDKDVMELWVGGFKNFSKFPLLARIVIEEVRYKAIYGEWER